MVLSLVMRLVNCSQIYKLDRDGDYRIFERNRFDILFFFRVVYEKEKHRCSCFDISLLIYRNSRNDLECGRFLHHNYLSTSCDNGEWSWIFPTLTSKQNVLRRIACSRYRIDIFESFIRCR